ncbi:methyltransferase [Bacillus nakamurai]|uniref:prepilin peptidase n=1 Tax=Bacillus nakamurai TaxID=1793963 RepID=UPI0007783E77|nr:A24 family peptidase [Bacillus nakamurai]KXZ16718.1 methyltransferase [Bacillus nakamurai]
MLFILFALGLILGSFFYTAGCRIPLRISIVYPRSACSFCCSPLSWAELIPVFSYAVQRGRCKSCRRKLSLMYPAAEWFTACLFTSAGIRFGLTAELFVALLFLSLLIIVTVTDLHYMLIPDKVLLFFLPFFIAGRFFSPLGSWYAGLAGAVCGFLLLAVIMLVSKGGIGGGDVKLFGVIGLALGIKLVLIAFFLSVIIGAAYGACAQLVGRLAKKQPFPFAPAIAAGSIVSYLYGEELFSFYIHLASG